jgi:glycerol-3-phosphate dehydrogenase
VRGARVYDRLSDEHFDIRAKVVVNAAGPWAPELLGDAGPRVKRIKGIHIVLPAIPDCEDAFLLTATDGRVFFVIPWYGRTIVGTTEREVDRVDEVAPTDDEVRYLLSSVRNGLPGLPWTEDDVIARYAGVRTLQPVDTADPSAITREFTVLQPMPNVLMPLGGKFTTARCDAVEVVDLVQKALRAERTPSLTARRPLPGTPETDGPFERWQAAVIPLLKQHGLDDDVAHAVTLRHGTRVTRIAELVRQDASLAARLHPELAFARAEAVLAVEDEMAWSLDDVLRRRIPLALLARFDGAQIREIAALLAPFWRRDPAEIVQEYVASR